MTAPAPEPDADDQTGVQSDRLAGADETVDAFLGGAVRLIQPAKGYRAGVDAVLLAAAGVAVQGLAVRVLDVGAGAGAIGLCVARRVLDARVVLVEREAPMVELARRNVTLNALGDRVAVVEADITQRGDPGLVDLGLAAHGFDCVLANPPYHDAAAGTPAQALRKARAHAMERGSLDAWGRFFARMAAPGGTATLIHRADALGGVLDALDGRFGGLVVLPIHARPGGPAIRVLVRGTKGSRAPLRLLAGFVLHGTDGHGFSTEAEAILRHGAPLPLD